MALIRKPLYLRSIESFQDSVEFLAVHNIIQIKWILDMVLPDILYVSTFASGMAVRHSIRQLGCSQHEAKSIYARIRI